MVSATVLVASSSVAFANCDSGEQVIKFSHVVADSGHPKGDAARAFASEVNAAMQGKFCVEVYPNSTLYDDNKVLEAMLLGDVQLAAPSLSKLEKYTKKFRVFDLPFLFNDAEAVYRFQDSADGAELAKSVESKGLLMLDSDWFTTLWDMRPRGGALVYVEKMYMIGLELEEMPIERWIAYSILPIGLVLLLFRVWCGQGIQKISLLALFAMQEL